ncbi:hypothetical protein T8K17_08960 [Thalassobaculum sp. OXR-137]|uniref:hypothetical protein n=1 Tax=Thalassobaculum sp. OXR-137 TaxID=3100173 RepID=UPI002AC9CCFB|nr:hypothetical protein [Thalassobaculum sp. OXR-137]WPZ36266.1 hypothetical protein T8K17_08960 [Thalassobaculum sp. OXR-137]
MSAFDALIADPLARRRYLVILEPYDPAVEGIVPQYFSDDGFVTLPTDTPADTYFDPRLLTALNFERQLFTDGRLSGRSVPGAGTLQLNNADGALDPITAMAFDGRRVRVLLGGEGFLYTQFETIFDGTADGIEFDDIAVTVRLRDLQSRFEAGVDRGIYGGTGGLVGRVGLKDREKPLTFGRVFHVPAILVDPASLTYQVHDGPIEDVDAVFDSGLALTKAAGVPIAGQYSVEAATGTFRLGASAAGTVTAHVRGDKTGGVYVDTVAGIMERLVTTRASTQAPIALDMAGFAAFAGICSYQVGLWIREGRSMGEVLDALADSVGAHFGFDRAGRMTIGRVEVPAATPVARFDVSNVLDLERLAVARPVWRQSVEYRRYWQPLDAASVAGAVGDEARADLAEPVRVEAAADPAIRTLHPLSEEAVVTTLLTEAASASAEASRLLSLFGSGRVAFRVVLKTEPFALELGQTVRLTYPRHGLTAGRNLVIVGMVEDSAVNEITLDLWG